MAFWNWQRGTTPAIQPTVAIQLYQDSKYAEALQECETFLEMSPGNPDALAIAGLSAHQQRDSTAALRYLGELSVPETSSFVYQGWLVRCEIETSAGRIHDAIAGLSTILEQTPEDPLVLRRIAKLYAGTGDHIQAVGMLMKLVDLGHASAEELMILAGNGEDLWSLDRVRRLRKMSPLDRHLIRAEWSHLRIRHRHDAALELLDESLAIFPDDAGLHIARQKLTGIPSANELQQLLSASESPELWMLLSHHFESRDVAVAIGCAVRVVEVDPFDEDAHRWLSELLRKNSHKEMAEMHLERSLHLTELFELCRRRDVFATGDTRRAVEILQSLGRYREAIAWCRVVLRAEPDAAWPASTINALTAGQPEDESKLLPSLGVRQLASKVVLDALPSDIIGLAIHDFELAEAGGKELLAPDEGDAIRFVDVAAECGLDTTFYNGVNAVEQGRCMHEFTGGGVGVLDVDGDAWPDLFFPQGADQPANSGDGGSGASDELHRNVRGQRFESIADVAGISDAEFGQGVAVSDLNSDGFDDIYVANLNSNAIWLNQGDGTFVRQQLEENVPLWTISAAILDVNGDSFADIYDVNYVTGKDVFQRLCDHEGVQRICSPTDFAAAQDELWFGNGDGTFRRGTVEAGLDQFSGRGMGIVAGDILNNGGIQLLVANDESANFFLDYDESGQFVDSALVRGIAFGRDGDAQGSMGIAAGRLTPGHQTDLFITNYYGELNCFHEQTPQGFFVDSIGATQLEHPGRPMLGFGTQFLDADADGDDDLFVANGHLDDFEHMSIPYRMPSQLFANDNGQFQIVSARTTPYLSELTLGRGVARLDWNRDGAMDLCVTHLDRPVALLENRSNPVATTFMLQWISVSGHRAAAGTVIRCTPLTSDVQPMESTISVPILAGDGYACSNERISQLVIPATALGVRIQGPDIEFDSVVERDASDFVRIIEGQDRMWSIPR